MYDNISWLYSKFFYKKSIQIIDPIFEYNNKTKNNFLKLFENISPILSYNIEKIIYDKKKLSELLSDSNNYLEKTWKSRIMIETTPVGNIVMYYDIFKNGFSYYCDQPIVSYDILNSVSMKYVMKFQCLDFFMDEFILPYSSPLKPIFFEDIKETSIKTKPGNELAIDMKNAPFAKLKNYNASRKSQNNTKTPVYFRTNYPWLWKLWFRIQYYIVLPVYKFGNGVMNWILKIYTGDNNKEIINDNSNETDDKPNEKEKMRNKFIYLGRFRNIQLLQPIIKNSVFKGGSTKYDTLFNNGSKTISYKDFKKNLSNEE